MFSNSTNKFWSLFMIGLGDVNGFKIYIQVCMAGLHTPDRGEGKSDHHPWLPKP